MENHAAEEAFEPYRIAGVELVEPITDNERYSTWHVLWERHDAFLKCAKTGKTRQRLANEAWGNQTMAHLADKAGAPFDVPQILAKDAQAGWLISEFIDGQPLSPGNYPKEVVLAAEPTMLDIYAFLDQALMPEPSYSPVRFGSSKSAEEMEQKIRGKLDEVPKAIKRFDPELIEDSIKFIAAGYHALKPAFTHGDLTPKYVLAIPGNKPFVIDFESCSLYWPRFYELINYTTKLSIVHGYAPEADNFISAFFDRIGQDAEAHLPQLKVISAARALLIVHEMAARPSNRRIYDTELNEEHRGRVEETLRRCLGDAPLVQA